jgi:hypothetical protein
VASQFIYFTPRSSPLSIAYHVYWTRQPPILDTNNEKFPLTDMSEKISKYLAIRARRNTCNVTFPLIFRYRDFEGRRGRIGNFFPIKPSTRGSRSPPTPKYARRAGASTVLSIGVHYSTPNPEPPNQEVHSTCSRMLPCRHGECLSFWRIQRKREPKLKIDPLKCKVGSAFEALELAVAAARLPKLRFSNSPRPSSHACLVCRQRLELARKVGAEP